MPAPALAFTAGRFAGKTAIVTGAACGGVDVLVSNAAVNHRLPVHELNRAQWDTQLAVNLTATFKGGLTALTRQVDARTAADPRVTGLEAAVAAATPPEKKAELVSDLAEARASVRAEKLSALARIPKMVDRCALYRGYNDPAS
jgi:hypothetical protein